MNADPHQQATGPAMPANPTAQGERPQRLAGLRLLLVEDNPINQLVAEEMLLSEGAQVTMADNGQLGVAAVAAATPPFHAVLMDLQMPVMDGYAATRAIRADWDMATLPIIALTANALPSDREACLQAGMNEHIGKPIKRDRLVAALLSMCAPEI